jgi:hypothetical protein
MKTRVLLFCFALRFALCSTKMTVVGEESAARRSRLACPSAKNGVQQSGSIVIGFGTFGTPGVQKYTNLEALPVMK